MSRRVEIGLEGGGVLLVTVEDGDVTTLTAAYTNGGGFHSVTSEEGDNVVDLAKVTYVRVLPGEAKSRLGFGGGA